jgi:hypothetical protein
MRGGNWRQVQKWAAIRHQSAALDDLAPEELRAMLMLLAERDAEIDAQPAMALSAVAVD